MELLKAHLSALLGICKLHIQISSVHMCVVPGPASQDAVFKRVYASPSLPCGDGGGRRASLLLPTPPLPAVHVTVHLYSSRTVGEYRLWLQLSAYTSCLQVKGYRGEQPVIYRRFFMFPGVRPSPAGWPRSSSTDSWNAGALWLLH